MATSESSEVIIDLLDNVFGADGKCNTIICARGSASLPETNKTVVFFPGDAQDLEEKMAKHRDNCRYAAWSLEKVARLIWLKFHRSDPNSNWRVLVIQPKERRIGTFAVYSNFLEVDDSGNPKIEEETSDPSSTSRAWNHLDCLLKSVDEHFSPQLPQKKLIVVGFSKGCVVVNELVREISHFNDVESLASFNKLTDIYWLDGGHNGGKNTWLANSTDLLPFLQKCASRVRLHVNVTPYQVNDQNRPWNGKECNRFIKNIQQFIKQSNHDPATKNKLLSFVHHFAEDTPSLQNHFRILEAFEI